MPLAVSQGTSNPVVFYPLVFHPPSTISIDPTTMPRIKTTRTVKIALFALRIYLIVMLIIILLAFFRRYIAV
jgi:hypothetical protein